ncbi:MAG: hypothetical protein HFJ12_01375 [Bacilli bacterium]|nr:hypothetical protein [Bacilli bacterium]
MNITVKEAARLMGKTEQFVRIGLQRNLLPIGTAIKNPGGKYSYNISPKLFEEYTGIKLPKYYFEYTEKKENTESSKHSNSL